MGPGQADQGASPRKWELNLRGGKRKMDSRERGKISSDCRKAEGWS